MFLMDEVGSLRHHCSCKAAIFSDHRGGALHFVVPLSMPWFVGDVRTSWQLKPTEALVQIDAALDESNQAVVAALLTVRPCCIACQMFGTSVQAAGACEHSCAAAGAGIL